MQNSLALSLVSLAAILLTEAAIAQTAPKVDDKIRDPEMQAPAQPTIAQPCAIDAAALRDPRINRDVLRVMQTNPYFAHVSHEPDLRYVVKVWPGKLNTLSEEFISRALGCGFYLQETNKTYRGVDGSFNNVFVSTALTGPGGRLFSEGKGTSIFLNGLPNRSLGTNWSQMKSLEATGSNTPIAVGNRYGTRHTTSEKSGAGNSVSQQCEVTERRPASEFNPRLTGDAFKTTCQIESVSTKDHKRTVSTSTFVTVADLKFVFYPNICRLEWHSATEFNRNLHGDAYVTRCVASALNRVFFPELALSFVVDTIDPAGFTSDPTERKLLFEVDLAR